MAGMEDRNKTVASTENTQGVKLACRGIE